MKKRIISGLAALAIVLSGGVATVGNVVVPGFDIPASAADLVYGDYKYKVLEDGTVEISKYTGDNNVVDGSKKVVEIPNSIDGKPVTSIGYKAFRVCANLTVITIPDGVTSIGDYAFSSCVNLSEINIPNSVTSIGYNAFSCCDNLFEINIPDGVTSIGDEAFRYCKNLTSVTIPNSVTSIGGSAFYNCTSLTSVTIPDGVTSIKSHTFWYCNHLTSVTIPDSVTSIGFNAFQNCSRLKSVTIPDGVTSIGMWAFCGCAKLTDITIPDSVTSIGERAFCSCTGLKKITLSKKLVSIGKEAFRDCEFTSITIPPSVTEICDMAVGYCYPNNKKDGFIIHGYKNTTAEKYAKDNGFDYELLDITKANPDVTYTPGENCANLEWNAVEGAEKYAVCGFAGGKWTKLAETADTSYVLDSLKAGEEYQVAVIAKFDGIWNADFSNAVTVTANDSVSSKYPKVKNIVFSENYHQFKLDWDPVDGAEKYGVAVFIANKWKIVNQDIPANKTNFTSPKLKAGDSYTLVVCAKVNGKWDTSNITSRAVTVTVI